MRHRRRARAAAATGAAAGLFLSLAPGASAVDMGSPWAPPSAAERFPASMWLNEVHITGNDAARTIEVAAVADAGISYSLIDAVLVDLTGAVVARKNLGAEGGCTTTRGVGANPALDIIVCADWASSGTLLLGGGLALVNNRGTATTADDLPINFVFTSRGAGDQAPVLLGMRASAFPVDQWQHALTPEGFSIQLVNTATYDPALKAIDPYTLNWQGMLPSTFGGLNAGQSQWGDFNEAFAAGTIAANWPVGQPGTGAGGSSYTGNPAVAPPLGPGTGTGTGGGKGGFPDIDPSRCLLGRLTEWSACSVPCISTSAASGSAPQQAVGWQIRYEPILFSTTGPAIDVAACPILMERSERRECAARSVRLDDPAAPADTCPQCNDGIRNGEESDVDCGGSMSDAIGNWTLNDATDWVESRYDPTGGYTLSGKVTSDGGVSNAGDSPICQRCNIGRRCLQHADCNTQLGLLCIHDACQPWWFVNGTIFADATLTIEGSNVRDFTQSASSTAAIAVLQRTVAEAGAYDKSSGSTSFVPAYNVSAVSWSSSASNLLNDGALEPSWGLQGRRQRQRQRQLANQGDSLTVVLRIGASTTDSATSLVNNLQSNAQLLSFMLQERLRIYSPTIGSITLSSVGITQNPFNFTQPEQSAKDFAVSSGLSGGAIAGIILGVIAVLAIVGVAAMAVTKYMNREKPLPPPPPPRRTMNIGETTPVEAAGDLAGPTPHNKQRAAFAPVIESTGAPVGTVGGAGVGGATTAAEEASPAATNNGSDGPLSAKKGKVGVGGKPAVSRGLVSGGAGRASAPPLSATSAAAGGGAVASP